MTECPGSYHHNNRICDWSAAVCDVVMQALHTADKGWHHSPYRHLGPHLCRLKNCRKPTDMRCCASSRLAAPADLQLAAALGDTSTRTRCCKASYSLSAIWSLIVCCLRCCRRSAGKLLFMTQWPFRSKASCVFRGTAALWGGGLRPCTRSKAAVETGPKLRMPKHRRADQRRSCIRRAG